MSTTPTNTLVNSFLTSVKSVSEQSGSELVSIPYSDIGNEIDAANAAQKLGFIAECGFVSDSFNFAFCKVAFENDHVALRVLPGTLDAIDQNKICFFKFAESKFDDLSKASDDEVENISQNAGIKFYGSQSD